MFTKMTRAAVVALAMMLPVAMQAQRGGGGGGRMGGGARAGGAGVQGRVGGGGMDGARMGGAGMGANPVAPLINMRRELNLSSRQLVQLDSIERTLIQRNQSVRDRMRTRLDSMRPRTRPSSEEEIQRFRAEGDSLRALRQLVARNDSVARVAAMSVLTDSQRVFVRERLAERRGFAAGRMSAMRGGRGGMQGFGPRMRRGAGGQMGGMGGPGVRGRGGMRGPDDFGPRFNDRRMPDDAPMPRFRRPPAEDFGPDGQGFAPRGRQFDDSTRFERAPRRPPVDTGR